MIPWDGKCSYPRDEAHPERRPFFIMVLVLAFLLVLLVAGLGFAVHLLWIAAAVLLVLWLVGAAIGRGESAGSRHFYRW